MFSYNKDVMVRRVLLLLHSEDVVARRELLLSYSEDVVVRRVLLLPHSEDVAVRSVAWQFHHKLSKIYLNILMMIGRVLVLPRSMELRMLQLFGMPSKPIKVPDFMA